MRDMTGLRSTISGFPQLARARRLMNGAQFDQAAECVMTHLRGHPGEPQGLAMLGEIANTLGALGQAEHFLRQAIARGAADFDTRRLLALVVNQQERIAESDAMFAQLERETTDPEIRALRAAVLDKLGRNTESVPIYEQLTRDYPDKTRFWIQYGHALRAAGRVPEAITAYRTPLADDYECGEGWWALASIKSRVLTDDDVATMQRGAADAVDVRNSAPLHFALGRALHDRGLYAEAFRHYAQGNGERAEWIGYDASELTAEIDEIVRLVDTHFVANLDEAPDADIVPVFIVSLPRSGSTLLEQMLGSHAEIEPVGELPYIPALLRTAMELATQRGRVTVPQLIAQLDGATAAAMGRDYLARAALHRRAGTRFFLDKLPHNWSNILFVKRILPQARFLDIRRPAMDCCFSNFTQSFSNAHASSFALTDIGRCYIDYIRMMRHLDAVAPSLVHHVDYERLIAEPEPELRAALDSLGLPWDPAILDFHKNERVVRTPSSEQVRRPLNRDGLGVWEPYAEWLGPLRDTLGDLAA
jgi:tetratricopeptide (TPR) repeat protein